MECKLIKGNEIQFGACGFEHINVPPEGQGYWDIKVKVAKIAEATSLNQGRFDVTLEKASPCAPFKHKKLLISLTYTNLRIKEHTGY